MNTIETYTDTTLDATLDRRVMRGFLSVTAFTLFLTGILITPEWIFALSALSIYFAMTAIIGAGPFDRLIGQGRNAEVVAIPRAERPSHSRRGVSKQAA